MHPSFPYQKSCLGYISLGVVICGVEIINPNFIEVPLI